MDWTRIDELNEEVGEEALVEILAVFISELDENIQKLKSGKSAVALAGDLHFLRGAALNVGFQSLADACLAGEAKIKSDDAANVDLAAITHQYHRCCAEIAERYPSS